MIYDFIDVNDNCYKKNDEKSKLKFLCLVFYT